MSVNQQKTPLTFNDEGIVLKSEQILNQINNNVVEVSSPTGTGQKIFLFSTNDVGLQTHTENDINSAASLQVKVDAWYAANPNLFIVSLVYAQSAYFNLAGVKEYTCYITYKTS